MTEKMKAIDIKGKAYTLINERVKYLKETFENSEIRTHLLQIDSEMCVFKAEIYVNEKLISTGHAFEEKSSSFINKTSYVENAETSAVGRALGFAGIGIDASIATFEEVANAINNQNKKPKPIIQKELSEDEVEIMKAKAEADKEKNNLLLEKYKGDIRISRTLKELEPIGVELKNAKLPPEIAIILRKEYTEKLNLLKVNSNEI